MANLIQENTVYLHDQFAMAALTGLAAGLHWSPNVLIHEDRIADDAYAIADAMLKARKVQP